MNKLILQITQATSLSTQQAWWLLEHVTKKNRTQLEYNPHELSDDEQAQLAHYVQEVAVKHKPLAYILGFVPFLDLELIVQPPTLIPRPETEAWVHEVICMLEEKNIENLRILDLGTGSGCIGLSLAQAFPLAEVYCLDIAQSAVDLAAKNAQKNNILNVRFLQSDLFAQLPQGLEFDLIVSNPPYIDPAVQLEKSVAAWEDHGALFASNHGIQIIEQIIQQAHRYIKKNDALNYQLIMEIDASQGDVVQKLLETYNFKNIQIKKDQFDRDRTAWAQ